MKLYRRIAFSFVVLTALVLIAVIYTSLVRAEIRITPIEQVISSSFIVDVNARPVEDGEVRGRVLVRAIEVSDRFSVKPASEESVPTEGKSQGVITVTNKRSTAQTLVEKTRFLSGDNVLFRLDQTTTVPAGGAVDVRVTADLPGASGDIPPAHFTIPGLSESVQAIVYGDSSEAMHGGLRYVTALQETDVAEAVAVLRAEAMALAGESMRQEASVFTGEVFDTRVVEQELDTEMGTETDQFVVKIVFDVIGVFFDEQELFTIAEKTLYKDIDQGLRLVGIDKEDLRLFLQRDDVASEMATLKVELSGGAIPSAAHHALSRGVFAGMTSAEVMTYFEENNLAKSVEVRLRPSWMKRLPRSPNKIKLMIE